MTRILTTALVSAALLVSAASMTDAQAALAGNGTSLAGIAATAPVTVLAVELPAN